MATLRGNSTVMKCGCAPSELRIPLSVRPRELRFVSLPKGVWIAIAETLRAKAELVGGNRPLSLT
jgi:hypothetical protein